VNLRIEQLGVTEDRLQRSAEFVAEQSEELGLEAIRLLRLFAGSSRARQ
jgi:hypothetical protein